MYRLGDGIQNPEGDWYSSVLFDVFDQAGRFLGTVHCPSGVDKQPIPYIKGDLLIAQFKGDDDVPYIRKYRIIDY